MPAGGAPATGRFMSPEPDAGSGPSAPDGAATPLVSVVIPVRNEAPNIAPLVAEIEAALASLPHEIVYVDDGSTDGTWEALRAARAGGAPVRALRHRESCGQSAAVITGVRAARGRWIATLDGDGQNDPADIPRLLARAEAEARAGRRTMVVGHRVNRKDSWVKRWSSRVANAVRSRLLRDRTPDTGCGLKVFPRDLFLELPHFDHMHRFLPALTLRQGGFVVSEPVRHRPRRSGASNYGTLDRLFVSIFDLIGMAWLLRRGKRPVIERVEGP